MSSGRTTIAESPAVAPAEPLLLRRRQVLKLLGISAPTLDRLVRAEELPVVRLGRRAVRIPLAAVHDLPRRRLVAKRAVW